MTSPQAAFTILEDLARGARTFDAPPDLRPTFFHHRSAMAEALARTDLEGAADAAADLQVGPGKPVTDVFRALSAKRSTYEEGDDLSKDEIEWLFSDDPDLVKFVVMNEHSNCFVVGATRTDPLRLVGFSRERS